MSCACYIEYDSVEELADFFSSGRQFDLPRPFLHIGGGSNLLFTGDFPGTVFHSDIKFIREYGKYAMGEDHVNVVSAIIPGVMGQTGMESTEIVRGIVNETHPDLVIAIDALAARSCRRLNRTVQIADTGIHPGSGVGNHRCGLTEKTLGVPVIGIGVPTVVDAATIVNDTMENFISALESSDSLKGAGEVLRSYSPAEKYEFVKEHIAPHLNGMFVAPKDVDEMIHQISHTIAEALNRVFSAAGRETDAAEA